MASDVYRKACDAVEQVRRDRGLHGFADREGAPSYCPRCGQRPWGDVRHDEAFQIAHENLPVNKRSRSLNFALELALWLRGES